MKNTVQFAIAKCWKQPKCPSVSEWIKNSGTLTQWNTTQHKERSNSYPSLTTWMELESMMLSEISQVVKDKYHMIDSNQRGGGRWIRGERRERVIKEHVQRTY